MSKEEIKTINAREAAFLALFHWIKEGKFILQSLEEWYFVHSPLEADFQLARQLAIGVCQRRLTLDFLGTQLSDKKRLKLKVQEKILLHLALFQWAFMDRIPAYAIGNEMGRLAKKYAGHYFAKFLNALLRKVVLQKGFFLPQEKSAKALSIRHSYPLELIQALLGQFSFKEVEELLELGNTPSPLMFRVRKKESISLLLESQEVLFKEPLVIKDKSVSKLSELAKNPDLYIQNVTPVALMQGLKTEKKSFKTILDLCASPGGKLILAHDFFPEASLFANDVSAKKLKKIEENLQKYRFAAHLSLGSACFYPSQGLFDLIICDVPCSNTGVLGKRAESRWRFTKSSLEELEKLQEEILKRACHLLAKGGEIWYLTCSILKHENENLVQRVANKEGLRIRKQILYLPNQAGWDGGFAAALTH